jgi:GT2 family glycosyltransferase
MLDQAQFTIIIPTRDRPLIAFELLFHLRTELGWRCPIVVADQSSDQGRHLRNLLEASPLRDVRHFHDASRGTGAARNNGVRLAETPWLLFLDDDVRPAQQYWSALADFVEKNGWADAVQGATEQRDAWQEYRRSGVARSMHSLDGCRASRTRCPKEFSGVEWLTTSPWTDYDALTIGTGSGNFAITRAAFLGAGGFDQQIEGLGDDREFGLRLWWYGYRVVLCPAAIAYHLREPSGGIRGEAKSRLAQLFAPEPSPGAVYLYLKWFPGQPFREMILSRLLKAARRPWTLPVKAIRLSRSIKIARARLAAGPVYASVPLSRVECIESARKQESAVGVHS